MAETELRRASETSMFPVGRTAGRFLVGTRTASNAWPKMTALSAQEFRAGLAIDETLALRTIRIGTPMVVHTPRAMSTNASVSASELSIIGAPEERVFFVDDVRSTDAGRPLAFSPDVITRPAISDKLQELHALAAEEGVFVSAASERDLLVFVDQFQVTTLPTMAVLDNGNIRVQWIGRDRRQVSLEFRGSGVVQFVIFVPRGKILASSAGRDDFRGISNKLQADCLLDLLSR